MAVVLFTVFRQFDSSTDAASDTTSYTQFMDDAKAGKIARVDIKGREITVTPVEGQKYVITSPGDLWMVDDLRKDGVQVYGTPEEEPSFWMTVLISWFPMLLLIGVWVFFMRQMQGGGKGLQHAFAAVGEGEAADVCAAGGEGAGKGGFHFFGGETAFEGIESKQYVHG